MTQITFSSRDFNQHVTDAKKASLLNPVFITDRGKPSHVLLSFEKYQELFSKKETIVELLAMDKSDEIEFEAPKANHKLFNPVEF